MPPNILSVYVHALNIVLIPVLKNMNKCKEIVVSLRVVSHVGSSAVFVIQIVADVSIQAVSQ